MISNTRMFIYIFIIYLIFFTVLGLFVHSLNKGLKENFDITKIEPKFDNNSHLTGVTLTITEKQENRLTTITADNVEIINQ